jgi:hypothetical protein
VRSTPSRCKRKPDRLGRFGGWWSWNIKSPAVI